MKNDLTLDEAKRLLLIDKHNLDVEVEWQPTIANRVGEKMVEFESLRDEAKEQVASVDAGVADKIRKQVLGDKGKITEANLASRVLLDDTHKEAMSEYLDLKKDAALWKIMREDYLGRAFMLSQMCGLHESEYFARVAVKDSIKDRIRTRMIEEKKEQRTRMQRNDS